MVGNTGRSSNLALFRCNERRSSADTMLTLQFGQCGNQLGHELFSKVSEDVETRDRGQSYQANYDYCSASCERWFSDVTGRNTGKRIARAILVDTERKVLDEIRGRETTNPRWCYSTRNEICEVNGGGAANNWSYGYFVMGKKLEADITEALRNECERSDRSDGFLLLLGIAGGTGSGVGSRVIETIRDEYATKTILPITILPFTGGEVGTQNYNGLLTLAKFTDLADAMILLENDRLLASACASGAASGGTSERRRNAEARNLRDTNVVACEKILSVLQPIAGLRNGANFFANKMAAHPAYKMATIDATTPLRFSADTSIPRTGKSAESCATETTSWTIRVKQLRRAQRLAAAPTATTGSLTNRATATESTNSDIRQCRTSERSVADMLITRGRSSSANDEKNIFVKNPREDLASSLEQFEDRNLYAPWTPEDRRFAHFHENRSFLGRDKYAALVANSSRIRRPLGAIVEGAWKCYTHGAFLHRYEQFGLDGDDFLRAFAKIENVIKLYEELTV